MSVEYRRPLQAESESAVLDGITANTETVSHQKEACGRTRFKVKLTDASESCGTGTARLLFYNLFVTFIANAM